MSCVRRTESAGDSEFPLKATGTDTPTLLDTPETWEGHRLGIFNYHITFKYHRFFKNILKESSRLQKEIKITSCETQDNIGHMNEYALM